MRVRTTGGGELVIRGEIDQHGPLVCSTVRARRYLQHGCFEFLAYVVDTEVEGKKIMDDVPIVREFPSVFPEHLLGLPPEK